MVNVNVQGKTAVISQDQLLGLLKLCGSAEMLRVMSSDIDFASDEAIEMAAAHKPEICLSLCEQKSSINRTRSLLLQIAEILEENNLRYNGSH